MSVTDFIALHLAFLCVRKKEKEGERARTRESKGEFVCMRVWVCPSNRVRKSQAVNRKAKLWSRA